MKHTNPTDVWSFVAATCVLFAWIPTTTAQPLEITTIAGSDGCYCFGDGVGSAGKFAGPTGVAVDPSGNVYVADRGNFAIRKITLIGTNWLVSTIAGSVPGQGISAGSADGIGGNAQFNWPYGVASAGSGILYVTDHEENHTVRKLSLTGTNWLVSTLAGLAGQIGITDGMGASARFNNPTGIAVDSKGNIFVVDQDSYIIRKITPAGVVTTLAGMAYSGGDADGTGASARFFVPTGVAVDSTDNIYVCDTGNNAIRKITPTGVVTTFVGLAAGNPQQWYPTGIAVDRQGNIFVADNFNMTIVKVKPDKTVATVAGLAGRRGGNDGIGSNARFYSPEGLAVDSSGALYIADEGDIIRKGVAYNGAPFISIPPQGTNIYAGTNAQFIIAVYGYTSSELALLRYQWQRKPAASNTWTNLASDGTYLGATTNSLTVRVATASMNGDEFRCVVTGPTGSTTSDVAVLTVQSVVTPPSVSIEPPEQTAAVGTRVMFHAVASGTPPLQFQWRKNGSEIPGATGADLVFEAVSPNDAAVYTVAVSNASRWVALASATLRLTAGTVPVITGQPQNQTVTPGAAAVFVVAFGGTPAPSLQWQRKPAASSIWSNLGTGGNYSGVMTVTLTVSNTTIAMSGDQFRCVASNSLGSTTSNPAILSFDVPIVAPTITVQPQSQTINVGDSAMFSVLAAGTPPLHYQWRKDDLDITGATNVALSLANVEETDLGNYSVVVANVSGSLISAPASLTLSLAGGLFRQGRIANWRESSDLKTVGDGTNRVTLWWSLGSNVGPTAWFYGSQHTLDSDVAYLSGVSNVWEIMTTNGLAFTTGSVGRYGSGSVLVWMNKTTRHVGALRVDGFTSSGLYMTGTWWFRTDGGADFSPLRTTDVPLRFTAITPREDGSFEMLIESRPGRTIAVQNSIDLVNWQTRAVVLATNQLGQLIFVDRVNPAIRAQFYQLLSQDQPSTRLGLEFYDLAGGGSQIGDVTQVSVLFDPLTGSYDVNASASSTQPFVGHFRFNLNVWNRTRQSVAEPISLVGLFNLSAPQTMITYSGVESRLKIWQIGDFIDSFHLPDNPTGSGTSWFSSGPVNLDNTLDSDWLDASGVVHRVY